MKFGSVFAGIGGFDLGLERVGMTPAWQCELNSDAQAILKKHWPDAVRHDDVRTLDASTREWWVDVVAGGFPCQDVSLCGKRAGLSGERSGLFWDFLRVAQECLATWLIIESVGGLVTSNGGRDFTTVLSALASRGYVCAYRVLDARHFGVPQTRERVFIVGHLGDWTGPARVLLEPASVRERVGESREEQDRTAGEVVGGAPFVFQTRIARCKRGLPSDILTTLTSYEGAGPHSDSKPHVVTPRGIRRLTPIEYERAMGFPDRWTETGGVSEKSRRMLCGNAVVPAIVEWIGQRIAQVELGLVAA